MNEGELHERRAGAAGLRWDATQGWRGTEDGTEPRGGHPARGFRAVSWGQGSVLGVGKGR